MISSQCADKAGIFAQGITDYLTYPLIADEILTRIDGCLQSSANAIAGNPGVTNDLVTRTCQFLLSDLSYDQGLEQLAVKMGTNRNTLSQAFRDEFKSGALSWFREQRLIKAADLLSITDMSVQRITFEVGYNDSNNFSTSFKKKYTLAPMQYRHKMRALKSPLAMSRNTGVIDELSHPCIKLKESS